MSTEQEYCCKRFDSFYKKHTLVHKHEDVFYMILWSDMNSEVYMIKHCPFCGAKLEW